VNFVGREKSISRRRRARRFPRTLSPPVGAGVGSTRSGLDVLMACAWTTLLT
jgi:hypothetical protein